VSLEGQLLHCGSEVQGKTAAFHLPDGPQAGCLPDKAFPLCSYQVGRRADIQKGQARAAGILSKRREQGKTWQMQVGPSTAGCWERALLLRAVGSTALTP